MKKIMRSICIVLCLTMLMGMSAFAAIPEMSGGNAHEIPVYYGLQKKPDYSWGRPLTATEISDPEFGSGYRFTTDSGTDNQTRIRYYVQYGSNNTVNADVQPGDSFYVSAYYRINSSATDSNVTAGVSRLAAGTAFHDGTKYGSAATVNFDEWHKIEGIMTYNGTSAREWWQSCVYFWWGDLESGLVSSIDITNFTLIHLGAATQGDGEATVLEQAKNLLSTDSSVTSIKFMGEEIYEEGTYEYEISGDVADVISNIEVTTNDPKATAKIIDDGDGIYLIKVYSEKADLTDDYPSDSLYTEYVLSYTSEVPEALVPLKSSMYNVSSHGSCKPFSVNYSFKDELLGSGVRITVSADSSRDCARIRPDFRRGGGSSGSNLAEAAQDGDRYYFSCYYRVNTPETDSNINSTTTKLGMPTTIRETQNCVDVPVTPGEWGFYEGFITYDLYADEISSGRAWSDDAGLIFFGKMNKDDTSTYSLDLCDVKVLFVGNAQDNSLGTVTEQVRATFSDNCKVSAINVNDNNIYVDGTTTYEVVGTADEVISGLDVTTEDDGAVVAISKVDDDTCKVTVYAQRANKINPEEGLYSEYTINCVEPETIIPVNDGKGIKIPFLSLNPLGGVTDSRTNYSDSTFGKVYRYNSEYVETHRWPRFVLSFINDEAISVVKDDLFYISFYWRSNTSDQDSYVTATPSYICRGTAINDSSKTTDIGKGDTMLPGQWHKEEFVIPVAATAETTGFTQTIGWGCANYGDKIGIDFAGMECYYIGNVEYNGFESGKNEAALAKFKENFSFEAGISSIKIAGKAIDLAANPAEYMTIGSSAKIINSLSVTATADDARVLVYPADDRTTEIKVVAHNADLRNPAENEAVTYVIYNDILVSPETLKLNGTAVTDYSAFSAGKYTLDVAVSNETEASFVSDMILVAYDSNDKVTGVGRVPANVAADDTVTIECEALTAPTSFKLFVWKGMAPQLTVTRITNRGIIE